MITLSLPARTDAPLRRTTRVTPLFERDRAKAKADRELVIGARAARAFALQLDRSARRSHASWDTIVAANALHDAAVALEAAVLADTEIPQ